MLLQALCTAQILDTVCTQQLHIYTLLLDVSPLGFACQGHGAAVGRYCTLKALLLTEGNAASQSAKTPFNHTLD